MSISVSRNLVREIRVFLQMSVAEFAQSLQFTAAYVYRLEDTQQGTSKQFALRVVKTHPDALAALNITLEDLLRGNRETPDGEARPLPAPNRGVA